MNRYAVISEVLLSNFHRSLYLICVVAASHAFILNAESGNRGTGETGKRGTTLSGAIGYFGLAY